MHRSRCRDAGHSKAAAKFPRARRATHLLIIEERLKCNHAITKDRDVTSQITAWITSLTNSTASLELLRVVLSNATNLTVRKLERKAILLSNSLRCDATGSFLDVLSHLQPRATSVKRRRLSTVAKIQDIFRFPIPEKNPCIPINPNHDSTKCIFSR